jgi:hypothetical protein
MRARAAVGHDTATLKAFSNDVSGEAGQIGGLPGLLLPI